MVVSIANIVLISFIITAPTIYLILLLLKFKKELLSSKAVLLYFTILTVIFFNKLLFQKEALAQQDFNNIQYPLFKFFHDSVITNNETPFWNPRLGGGFDAFANPLSAYFTVFNFVFLLSSNTYLTLNIFIALQILMAGVFCYLLFRKLGFGKFVSVVPATAFMFNGFVAMRLSPDVGPEYLYTYKWIPLIMTLLCEYFENQNFKNVALLGIATAFLFEGNPNIVFSAGIFLAIFVLLNFRKIGFKGLLRLLPIAVICLSIYAVKLVPAMDLAAAAGGRISREVSGWRRSQMDLDRVFYFYTPKLMAFKSPLFTAGIIAFALFLMGIINMAIAQ